MAKEWSALVFDYQQNVPVIIQEKEKEGWTFHSIVPHPMNRFQCLFYKEESPKQDFKLPAIKDKLNAYVWDNWGYGAGLVVVFAANLEEAYDMLRIKFGEDSLQYTDCINSAPKSQTVKEIYWESGR